MSTRWTITADSDISSNVALNAATWTSTDNSYIKSWHHKGRANSLYLAVSIYRSITSKQEEYALWIYTNIVGNFWMNPTVSVRRNSVPFFICIVMQNYFQSWSYVQIIMNHYNKIYPSQRHINDNHNGRINPVQLT